MDKIFSLILCILFGLSSFAQTPGSRMLRGDSKKAQTERRMPFGRETVRCKASNSRISVVGKQLAPKTVAPSGAGDGTTLWGEVTYSTLMDDASDPEAIKWGLYSFPAKAGTSFSEKYIHNTICANGGGTYRKGKLYFTSYYEGWEPGMLLYLYFCSLDVATGQMDKIALQSDRYTSIGLDMTYDPVGDIVYMQAYPANVLDATEDDYTLSTMNIETGLSTPTAKMPRMSMIACDISGQLYGVRYKDGMFCKIDKATAAVTEIGMTGVNPMYNGSGTFDFQTGKLYWTTTERMTDQAALYEIDPNSGKAEMISVHPNNEQVTCLYIPRADDVCNLEDIPVMTADFSNASSTTGTITIQAPAADVSGTPLTGDVTISLYIDEKLTLTKPCAPGGTITETLTLAKGGHKAEAVATHATAGKSKRKTISIWVGLDGPAAAGNLKAEKTGEYTATLSWDTPLEGAHGGTINPALVYYEIRRFPGNELLADDVTGNTFTDNITSTRLRYYSYAVTGYYKGVAGETAESNRIVFGEPTDIPYKETFDTFDDFKTYLVFNENNDDGFWGWNQGKQCAMYKYDTFKQGDDWLLTPALRLSTDRTYKLKFKARSDSRLYPEDLEVYMGGSPAVVDMTTLLMEKTTLAHEDYREYEAVVNVKTAGNYFIGFHAVTIKGQYYLYIDDVEVVAGPSANSPGVVTDFTVTPAPTGATTAEVAFTAPAENFEGGTLSSLTSITLYRNGELIKTFNNPEQGARITYTDNSPEEGENTYRATAANEFGEGNSVEVLQWIGNDVPQAPTNVAQTTPDGKKAIITWTASTLGVNGSPLDPTKVTYNIYDNKERVVATGLTGVTYTDNAIDVSKGQKTLFYYVEAVTGKGASYATGSNFITYGEPYSNGFKESFAGKQFETSDWIIAPIEPSPFYNEFYGRYWGLEHSKYDRGPRPEAQDGDNGYLIAYTDMPNVESRIITPKMNISQMKNPVLSFWFYQYFNPDSENGYSHPDETMAVETYINGEYKEILPAPIRLINGNGWYRYDVLLKDKVGAGDFQLAFKAHNYLSYDMHIDNIAITDIPDNDLSVTAFDVPEKIAVGSTRNITATVYNGGAKEAGGYKVEFLRDGNVFESVSPAEPLAFASTSNVSVEISPSITDAGKVFTYSARVVFASDEDITNNTGEEVRSEVPTNNLPTVTTLKAIDNGATIELTWDEPAEPENNAVVTDGFEQYEAFTISNMGEWALADLDGIVTYTISNSASESGDYEYPNAGAAMAYQVFNPSAAGITSKLWTPYLGNQMAVCFDAAGSINNDWLISPEVPGGSNVSFMARSVTDLYGLEKFQLCYSTTDREPGSFIRLGEATAVPADASWTRFEFTLPADAKYFAINCVSENVYALLIDEITYESISPAILSLQGFNVYRDGEKINSELIEEGLFTDTNDKASHSYNVTAVYDRGESMLSNTAQTGPAGISQATGSNAVVYSRNNSICIDNANGQPVAVYNTGGQTLYKGVADSNHFNVNAPSGVYVVVTSGTTTKIALK